MGIKDWLKTWKNRRKHRFWQAMTQFIRWGIDKAKTSILLTIVAALIGAYLFSTWNDMSFIDVLLDNLPTSFGLDLATLVADIVVLGFLGGGVIWTFKIAKAGRYEQLLYVIVVLVLLGVGYGVTMGLISPSMFLP